MKALDQAGCILCIEDFGCYWPFGDVDVHEQEDLARDARKEHAGYFEDGEEES